MGMKLRRYAGSQGSVLILDTGGALPDRRDGQLLCCRSLTLPVDVLLLGPLGRGGLFRVAALDVDGLPALLGKREAEAFGAFLRDEGYAGPGPVYVSDGCSAYVVPAGRHGWQPTAAPEGRQLARLLGL